MKSLTKQIDMEEYKKFLDTRDYNDVYWYLRVEELNGLVHKFNL